MHSLRSRFLLSHLLPVLLILPLAGLILLVLVETQVLLADLSTDLTRQATLIAALTQRDPAVWQDSAAAESLLQEIAAVGEGEIFFFLVDGSLLTGSATDNLPQLTSDELDQLLAGNAQQRTQTELLRQQVLVILPVETINTGIIGLVAVSETVSGAESTLGRLRFLFLLVLGVELLLAGGMAVWLSGRLARPLSAVSQAVMNIATGRDNTPLPEQGPAEISLLIQAVNILTQRLHLLEETRRRSLANIVHELGRPLGAIRSAVHVLRQGAGEDPAVRSELLAGVETEIERMQPLLDDLSMLHGQVSAGSGWASRLDIRPVDLATWLPGILLPWRAAALEKELAWQATISPDLPVIEIDTQRMAQAIGNLLSNAVKFTPAGGAIIVTANPQADRVRITISDNGPGIAPEEQEQIFEPFYRSGQQRRFPQGLGLGLTIAREIVHAHGGQVSLDSRPGAGAHFTLTLPVPPESRQTAYLG
jgi:signal transduction histidine kinase